MRKFPLQTALLAAALALAGLPSAQAIPYSSALRYSSDSGATWTTVLDNGAGDNDIDDGSMNVVVPLAAGYKFTVLASQTKPVGGATPANPVMDLSVQGSAAIGATTFIIEFSDVDWTPVPSGEFITRLSANNTTGMGTTLSSRVGANTLFASPGIPLSTIGPLTFAVGEDGASAPYLFAPYSITLRDVYQSDGLSKKTISTDSSLTVPDGGSTMILLGAVLSGFAFFARSRKMAKQA